ncbi:MULTISPECIES: sugar ABC transporter substrate-binding protein [Roseobacteraceae]|jgi:ribose transport system substrate-binding protein|uniref:Carbohydrate binding protein n=1 Tax=Celeribacter baekdonensis B30 TaxID=1208323 RepID=K2JVI8_9RHOB|nr:MULTISPECIES: sugar ABC transporter substrate-binding protein [Roseobacteraceae]EKE74324.1 carbohydrate binding protein [Celeribacter baekdonensis B30]KAB6716684.1 sugar ABC transporter substrate-binding protein [Roseobacter sp. TSBP12]
MTEEMTQGGLNRRMFMAGTAAVAASVALWPKEMRAQAAGRKFAASLGWTTYDSGRHLQDGFNAAVAELGGELTMTDAGFDARVQSDQIDSLVATKPEALFITPADAVAIAPAVERAIAAGIPVFCADSAVPGAIVTTTAMSNNFGMGQYSCEYICKALNGKGKIARVMLPQNESWDQRTLGMEWTLRRYPEVEIVTEWAFALAGNVSPRQAVDNILTSHPDVDAIWCAWDGAAVEGTLAARAAGRNDLILTGIDGGSQAFNYIAADTPLKLSMAQSFYEMAYLDVFYAHELLAGRNTPRLISTPTYAVTKDMLQDGIPDNFDVPGEAEKMGWSRAL